MSEKVTVSFQMDKNIYNAYKNIVKKEHGNVKGNLISCMKDVIQYGVANQDTIDAIKETESMKKHPDTVKTYSYDELDQMFEDLSK